MKSPLTKVKTKFSNMHKPLAEGVRFELTDALQHRRFSVLLWLSPPDDALSV